jgi:transcriptional regulator with XRE-family HTH domain
MGTLGRYLQDARNARGIDLREAAQQTRISIQYLKALEDEDFSKLPGEVFVRGFLKSYGRFLSLNEAEVMKKYGELQQKPVPAVNAVQPEPSVAPTQQARSSKLPIEPFIWAAGIIVVLIVFLFTALPRHPKETHQPEAVSPAVHDELASGPAPTVKSDKLYLEVIALENTWLLVRTDASPQKKAVLNKGESLIWSADQRFLLSYGSAGAIKLLLNGQELTVNEPQNAVIRDLVITAAGIENRRIQADKLRPAKSVKQTAGQEQVPQAASSVHAQQSQLSTSPQQSTVRTPERTAPTGTGQKPHRPAASATELTAPSGTQ